ncbi:MAG TPA: hypothetical protein VF026_13905 [Ktedonobacteraceae bacterium]
MPVSPTGFANWSACFQDSVCRVKRLREQSREPLAQPGSSKRNRSTRRRAVRQGVQHDEVVDGGLEPHRCDAHPRLPQLVGIGLPLIAQHVGLGGDDERRGEPLQLLGAGAQRRGGDLVALARVARVLLPEPHHGVAPQVVALGELVVGRGIEGRIGDRVEQQLEPNVRPPALPGQERDHRSHVAPDAVASHGETLGIQAMLLPAPGDPPHRHIALLEGRRVADLGAEPVHREHDSGPGSDGEFAHQPVMRLRAAEHPPGPVDVHDNRQRSLRVLWPQDAKRHLRTGAVCNGQVFDVDHGLVYWACLRLIESEPSLLRVKRERPR